MSVCVFVCVSVCVFLCMPVSSYMTAVVRVDKEADD